MSELMDNHGLCVTIGYQKYLTVANTKDALNFVAAFKYRPINYLPSLLPFPAALFRRQDIPPIDFYFWPIDTPYRITLPRVD